MFLQNICSYRVAIFVFSQGFFSENTCIFIKSYTYCTQKFFLPSYLPVALLCSCQNGHSHWTPALQSHICIIILRNRYYIMDAGNAIIDSVHVCGPFFLLEHIFHRNTVRCTSVSHIQKTARNFFNVLW